MKFRFVAAVSLSLTAAFILSACGAQPSNLPTATPAVAKPTSASDAAAVPTTAAQAAVPSGNRPYAKYTNEQRAALQKAPPPMTIDATKKYIATIKTSKGDIVVELNPQAAPNTVNNFVYLAQNGFYDGLTFHRVEPGFVIQGGDPVGDGTGGPGYNIPPEIKLPHVAGAIAMARQGGDPATTPSSGSQFYITLGAQPNLDNAYTVFGTTVRGQVVAAKIAIGDKIESITITSADGSAVKAADAVTGQAVPTPAPPKAATCSPFVLSVASDDHFTGNADASATTIIEYGDFQCPSCAAFHAAITPTLAAVSDTLKLVFRHFPLITIHDKSLITAHAVEAATLQNKFWEMHDLLYEKQKEWEGKSVAEITGTLKTYAQQLGMDADKLEKDMSSQAVIARVQRDIDSGTTAKLAGTPSLFLDGRTVPPDAFVQQGVVDGIKNYAKARAEQLATLGNKSVAFAKPELVTSKDAKYVMTVKTTKGDIVAELDPALAPVNVNSVVFLAQQKYFEGAPVVLQDAQLGAVLMGNPTATGNPGYVCDQEKSPAGAMTKPGVVALYTTDGQTASAQFVLTYSPTTDLDGRFTVIGNITSGLDVLKTLTMTVATSGTVTTKGDSITGVTVAEKK